MERFPGRTLEELDGIDWLRYQRALEAMAVSDVETRRAQHVKGLIKSSDLSADEWERIKVHDAMLDEDGA